MLETTTIALARFSERRSVGSRVRLAACPPEPRSVGCHPPAAAPSETLTSPPHARLSDLSPSSYRFSGNPPPRHRRLISHLYLILELLVERERVGWKETLTINFPHGNLFHRGGRTISSPQAVGSRSSNARDFITRFPLSSPSHLAPWVPSSPVELRKGRE